MSHPPPVISPHPGLKLKSDPSKPIYCTLMVKKEGQNFGAKERLIMITPGLLVQLSGVKVLHYIELKDITNVQWDPKTGKILIASKKESTKDSAGNDWLFTALSDKRNSVDNVQSFLRILEQARRMEINSPLPIQNEITKVRAKSNNSVNDMSSFSKVYTAKENNVNVVSTPPPPSSMIKQPPEDGQVSELASGVAAYYGSPTATIASQSPRSAHPLIENGSPSGVSSYNEPLTAILPHPDFKLKIDPSKPVFCAMMVRKEGQMFGGKERLIMVVSRFLLQLKGVKVLHFIKLEDIMSVQWNKKTGKILVISRRQTTKDSAGNDWLFTVLSDKRNSVDNVPSFLRILEQARRMEIDSPLPIHNEITQVRIKSSNDGSYMNSFPKLYADSTSQGIASIPTTRIAEQSTVSVVEQTPQHDRRSQSPPSPSPNIYNTVGRPTVTVPSSFPSYHSPVVGASVREDDPNFAEDFSVEDVFEIPDVTDGCPEPRVRIPPVYRVHEE